MTHSTINENFLLIIILSGLISIIYGYFTSRRILKLDAGNKKMREVAEAIQIGAKAYLNSNSWGSCFNYY